VSDVATREATRPLIFTGGHATDPRDAGRPVVLIAAALDVPPEVFREAFSGVTPAHGRRPTSEETRRNKEELLRILAPLGVTNERLDEVSNYYRYRPERDELWRTTPAEGHAIVENENVKKIVVTNPGSGYSSPPMARVKGLDGVQLEAKLRFGKDLKKNGAVASLSVAQTAD
jgi:hypothetical protein